MLNLQLSKEQFRTLLELAYLGNMMANGHRNEQIEKYSQMEELLFSLAPHYGITDCSDVEEPKFPIGLFEERLQNLVDEYDETTFWEELVDRLTTMLKCRNYTPEQLNELSREEHFKVFFEYEDKIRLHLSQYGLEQFPLPEES